MPSQQDLKARVAHARTLLQDIRSGCGTEDWGTKVELFCEVIWEALDHSGVLLQDDLLAFSELLKDFDFVSIAQLVIPEFRSGYDVSQANAPKRPFIDLARKTWPPTPSNDTVDSAMYKAEKDALYDAVMYRTMLFLRQSENFDEEQLEAIRKWLDDCPVKIPSKEF